MFKILTLLTLLTGLNLEAQSYRIRRPAVMKNVMISNQTNSDIEFKINKQKWQRLSPWKSTKKIVSQLNKIYFRTISMMAQSGQSPQETRSYAFAGTVDKNKSTQSFYVYGKNQVLPERKLEMVMF